MNNTKTLLIVEDSTVNRKVLNRILTSRGFETLQAENGKAALKILQEKQDDISLVLLDLTMPIMNGYELLNKMKDNGMLSIIPVIVTTGSDNRDDEIKSLECGASDFVTKPYNPEIVYHRVESILRLCDNTALISKLEVDRLTGLYTREAFYRYAEIMLDANPDEKYDVICSNIENFKLINSKCGIDVGDKLLQFVAEQSKEYVGDSGVCGRLGSDVFVALVKRRESRSQEEIGKIFEETYKDAPVKNFMMQYGVYKIEDRDVSISDICDCAQLALTTIKHKYGLYYATYDDSMRKKIFRDHQLTNYMEQALEEKQFVVYLQPKHNVKTGEIAGAEALVRWIHPEIGFISPGEFIPLFEQNGFITKLDRYIWESVCQVLQRWKKEGRKLFPISVNASRADFAIDNLAEIICDMVQKYDVSPEVLHIEVTESAYTTNPQQIISTVSMLRSLGFEIEMDDFGSGYSSLNMLSELPIDILKLDMKFMQKGSGAHPENKRSILSFTVSLAKWLQLPTVAEGVETEDEVKLLKVMGCDYIQGYFFAKPMPVADFEKYMEEKAAEAKAKKQSEKQPQEETAMVESEQDLPHILVAEDIESNRELLREILEPYYDVHMVVNGAEALEYIRGNEEKIDCVLLDLLMPVMDGFQLLDKMKAEGSLKQIPVIITSEAGTDSELRAIRIGADSFVSKPYNSELLLHHVSQAVHEREFRKMNIEEK